MQVAPFGVSGAGPSPTTCPRCGAAATPAPGPQPCRGCAKSFALYAGPALDGAVVPPPPDPRWDVVKVKSAGVMTYRFGVLKSLGVSEGQTDPVTGRCAMAKPEPARAS